MMRISPTLLLSVLLSSLVLFGCAADGQDHQAASKPVAVEDGATSSLAVGDLEMASPLSQYDASGIQVASTDGGAQRVARLTRLGTRYVVLHMEFLSDGACRDFEVAGAHVFHRYKRFADVMVPAKAETIQAVARSKGLLQIEPGGRSVIPPAPAHKRSASRATAERIVRGGMNRLTGRGVIVAVIDSGIDFRHPDFITLDEKGRPVSRILQFWDTTSPNSTKGIGQPSPFTYPGGASIGTIYTQAELTADLRAEKSRIGITDANGHGTSCASVAAGNGRGESRGRYTGVAPGAGIIAVRIGGTSTGSLENSYLLGAITSWIDSVAGSKPCVLSCSFGGQRGARDGSSVMERQLDARFTPERKGRALCIAAGNDGKQALHARLQFSSTRPALLKWTVAGNKGSVVSIFLDQANAHSLAWGFIGRSIPKSSFKANYNRISKRSYFTIQSPPGTYVMKVMGKTAAVVTADAYIPAPHRFSGDNAKAGSQVATPGTSTQAITVGSYDFNDQLLLSGNRVGTLRPSTSKRGPMIVGALSGYSNPGPRRLDHLQKPDLTAPGQYHIAAAPLHRIPADSGIPRERSNRYRTFNGTSAATPYCAGVIALMLQKNPKLSVHEIKSILQASVSKDRFTGQTPNPQWGFGKLDLVAVQSALSRTPNGK